MIRTLFYPAREASRPSLPLWKGFVAGLILMASGTAVQAQSVWVGTPGSSFNAIPNWSGGVPSATVAGMIDVAHTGAYQINVANAVILGDLTIGDLTAVDAGGFELTGSTITFNKVGGNALTKQGTALDVVRNALTLSTALNANVVDAAGTLQLDGAIGAGTLTKTGDGKLLITGTANNALNLLNAQQGTVVLAKASSSSVRAVSAALNIGGSVVANSGVVQIGGTFAGSGNAFVSNYRDQIALGTIVTVNAFGSLDLNGNSEGISQLLGSGKVTNSVADTTSTLAVGDGSSAVISFDGVIEDGAGIVSLVKTGSGTLTLNGANTFTGDAVAAAGILTLAGAQGSLDAATIRIVRGTLVLDNSASNNNDRILDTATVLLAQNFGTNGLIIRRNSTAGTNTQEKIGTLSVQNGHNVVRFDHSAGGNATSILANVLTLEMDNYTRGTGGTVAFTEFATGAAPNGYSYYSTTAPASATTLTKIILNNLPSEWLVGGNGTSGYNRTVLIGAFGNMLENSVTGRLGTRLMTVDTVNGVNYIRPLDSTEFREIGTGATTRVIAASNLTGGTPSILGDDNVKITGTAGGTSSPLAIRIGVTDNKLAGHIAFNSWWQESPVTATLTAATVIRIAGNNVVHLGDWAGDSLHAGVTGGSGTMFFNGGLATTAVPAGGGYGSATIRGGTLDFGSREALIYLDVTNAAHIYSTITGTGGLTKTGGGQAHIWGWNTYSGVTTHALNELWVYTDTALGQSGAGNSMINYATFLIMNGINVGSSTDDALRKDFSFRAGAFYAGGNKSDSWNGDIKLESTSEAGEYGTLTFTVRQLSNLIINGDVTGVGAANSSVYTSLDAGRTLIIQNEQTSTSSATTPSVRSINGNFVLNGSLSDIDGRAALATHEKLVLRFTGYTTASASVNTLTHNKFNVFIEDATKTNAYVDLTSGYLHFNKGFGVDGTNFSRTFFRQNDGNTVNRDRAGNISAILLGEAGAAYRTGSFIYGNNAAAYSSNSTAIMGGENTSGTVTFGHSNGATTFTFGMNTAQDSKSKAAGWTNLTGTRQTSAASAGGSVTITLADVSGLSRGMLVEGTGILAGTKISHVDYDTGIVTLTAAVNATSGVGNNATLSFYNLGNTVTLADVTNLQVGMAVTGTGIRPGTVIIAIDSGTKVVTLSAPLTSAITAAATFNVSYPRIVVQDTLSKTQNFGEARLYQAAGGTSEFVTSFTDGVGFKLDSAVGAITKVGRGTAILKGGTASSDVNGGINVLGGALVLDYAGKAESFSHVSGGTTYQNNPYQLTLAGGELRLVNEGSASTTNSEYLRGALTLRSGNSSIVIKPGEEKTLNLHLGLANVSSTGVALQRYIPITVSGNVIYVENPDWYWRAPDRFAGATLNLYADTTVDGSANFFYSQNAPNGAATGSGVRGLGMNTIIPYTTFKYKNGGGQEFVDFAAFLVEGGNTRFVDAAGAVANSANLYNANGGQGAWNVAQWDNYVTPQVANGFVASTGYLTDDAFGGGNGFTGTLTGNLDSTEDSFSDFVGARVIRFAASDSGGSVITLGSSTRLVVGSTHAADDWDGPGASVLDGGAILISNSVGATNTGISGGYLTSAQLSAYFTNAVPVNSMTAAAEPAARDLIIHNYNTQGDFTISSTIVDYTENHDDWLGYTEITKVNLVVAGPGTTHLTQTTNLYTGNTYVSGGGMNTATGQWEVGTLRVPAVTSLGTGSVFLNGGRLRFANNTNPATSLSSISFGSRTLTLGGNGGYIDLVAAGTTLTITGAVRSENNVLAGNLSSTQMSANPGVGDLIKEGLGRLILTNATAIPTTFDSTPISGQAWNAYYGLTTVKAGTLQVTIGSTADSGILGSNDSSIDGTLVEEGARLDVQMTASTAGTKEWITLDGGTLGTTASHTDGYIDGVLTITAKGGILDVSGVLRLNAAEGFLTGSGNLVKTGGGTLFLYQNNVNFTGNIDIQAGRVNGYTQGLPFGSGSTIMLGSPTSVGGEASLLLYANQGFTTQYRVIQDIVVRANAGAQVRNIGAGPVGTGRNQDSFFFEGDITLNGDAHLVFFDQTTNLQLAPTAGDLQSTDVAGSYRNIIFNGHFSGAGNLFTDVSLSGAGANGAKVTFLINGDNSSANGQTAWTGTLTTGNAALNNLQEHFIRMGNNLAMTAANKVELGYNSALQLGGKTVSIGDLKARVTGNASTNKIYVENAANDEGTLRVVQTANTDWDILFQDGVTPEWYSSASAAVYSNRLNLVKAGAGTAVLTQLNTYTGTTVVETGNLQVGRGGVGTRASADTVGRTGTGALSVNNGGVLSGTGVVQARAGVVHSVNNGGKLAPGDAGGSSLGTLFMDGGLVLNAGGTLEFQIKEATHFVSGLSDVTDTGTYSAALLALPGASQLSGTITTDMHDHLEINGQMDLSGGGLGAGTISVVSDGYLVNAGAGDVFNLIDWSSVNAAGFNAGGTYRAGGELGSNLLLPTLGSGLAWDTSLFTSHGILIVTTVPEPGRMMLVLLAGAAWGLRRRRSRARVGM